MATDLSGLDDVIRAMQNLAPAIEKTILAGAMRKGANLVAKAARDRAPVRTGNLKQRIAVRKRKRKPQNVALAYAVGILGGASASYGNTKSNRRKGLVGKKYQKQDTAFYWRFLEFGTKKMAAKPFLRPAFDQSADAAINVIAAQLRVGLDKAVKKARGL